VLKLSEAVWIQKVLVSFCQGTEQCTYICIRITQLRRGKKDNDISGRYALIGCRLVTKISQVEINPQRVFFKEF